VPRTPGPLQPHPAHLQREFSSLHLPGHTRPPQASTKQWPGLQHLVPILPFAPVKTGQPETRPPHPVAPLTGFDPAWCQGQAGPQFPHMKNGVCGARVLSQPFTCGDSCQGGSQWRRPSQIRQVRMPLQPHSCRTSGTSAVAAAAIAPSGRPVRRYGAGAAGSCSVRWARGLGSASFRLPRGATSRARPPREPVAGCGPRGLYRPPCRRPGHSGWPWVPSRRGC
jgi:hypothetical protein